MHSISYAMMLADQMWLKRDRRGINRNGGLVFWRFGIIGGSFYITFN